MSKLSMTALGGLLALSATVLLGCGGGGDSAATTVLSNEESTVGAALLSPDSTVLAASSLTADELPPDATATAVVDDADLPPTS